MSFLVATSWEECYEVWEVECVCERERWARGQGERKVNAKNVYLTSLRNFSGIFLTMHLHHITASNTCSVAVLYVLYTFF